MQTLLITREPPLLENEVASGNAIRTRQLESAFQDAGHAVSQVWLSNSANHPDAFRNRDELQSLISQKCPDAIVVSYWDLLALLPFELQQPVILDFIAPRPLELLYQKPEQVGPELKLLQRYLCKCDLILVGNQAQRDLLWFTLLQAGFDLRGSDPLLVMPLAAEFAGMPRSDPQTDGWTLVSGGVDWPWRKSDEYWKAIRAMTNSSSKTAPRLVLFGGQYKWQPGEHANSYADQSDPMRVDDKLHTRELQPYASFSQYLKDSAHIGLEVAQPNIERRFSQSFRSLEFLRHGLPIICNDYLPIAGLIEHYEAGWTINDPAEIEALIESIMQHPEEWRRRSENARKLVEKALNPRKVAQPLLEWLDLPTKAPRLPASAHTETVAMLGRMPLAQRFKRQWKLLRRAALTRLFRPPSGENVLMVTRSDIFPADHGAAVKIVETAKALSRQGCKVGIVSDNRRQWWLFENGEVQVCRLPFYLRLLSLPGPLAKLLHLSKDLPESNAFLYLPLSNSSFFWHCLYVGKKLHAGILQAEFPAYAQPCIEARDILNAAVVLVEHNVEYSRLQAQVPELSEPQYKTLQAIELDLCNRSDAVICVSDNDRQILLGDGVSPALLHTIPHGFDPEPFTLPARKGLREQFGLPENALLIAFHGTFSYPPNRDALQVFASLLLPKLADHSRPFHVLAIGRNPPADSLHAHIHYSGSVDQVGPWLSACDMAVIPLRQGGGTRMKIIDCFAAGLPVISTSKGIEGIPVTNHHEALICDDWNKMVKLIVEVAESEPLRTRLTAAATEFAANMDWNSIARRYLSVFSTIRRTPK